MYATFSRFVRDDSGGTFVQYGLIAGLVGAIMISAFTIVGAKLTDGFTNVGTKL